MARAEEANKVKAKRRMKKLLLRGVEKKKG